MTKEELCLVHRYLYYVLNQPVISDYQYDELERLAKKDVGKNSILLRPGSDLESSYPLYIREEAIKLLNN